MGLQLNTETKRDASALLTKHAVVNDFPRTPVKPVDGETLPDPHKVYPLHVVPGPKNEIKAFPSSAAVQEEEITPQGNGKTPRILLDNLPGKHASSTVPSLQNPQQDATNSTPKDPEVLDVLHNAPSFFQNSENSESRLADIITRDLCQGGILSQSLPGYEERPVQIEMATLVAHSLTQGTPTIVEAGTGTGKALDVDTPIPTPTGWKRMGDLVEGDFVFDDKGIPTRVRAAFDVMYHRKCYEVVFSDGSSLIADAEHEWASYTYADRKWADSSRTDTYVAKNFVTSDQLVILDRLIALSENDNILSVDGAVALIGGHQWSVYQAARKIAPINSKERPARYAHQALLSAIRGRLARNLGEQRRDGRTYSLVTTDRMADTLTVSSSPRANHAIAVAGPLALPDADLPIAPYFLGVWLGDGSSYSNQITSADPSLINEIEKDGYTVRSLKSHPYLYAVDDENGKAVNRWHPGMTGRLRALGLLHNKHIPAVYLRASEQQRRALLAGLLDTDGTVNHCGAIEFTTTSPRLAQDVYELMCSLGFRPSLRCGRARLRGKDCGAKWTLGFTTDEQVFRLERKAIAQKDRPRNYSS